MLSLTVREGDYITIGPDIVVQVLKTGDVFRLAVEAPKNLRIERSGIRKSRGEDAPLCIRQAQKMRNLPPRQEASGIG